MTRQDAMYRLDIQVQPRPSDCRAGEPFDAAGTSWPTLQIAPDSRSHGWATFDAAMSALEALPRMFVEPDGAFLWVGGGRERWQVDGNLFDRGDELAYVTLKGTCPPEQFDELLRCFGWPAIPIIFQLNREGVYVDEDTFRALAERPQK